jgi:hypothetical protein
MTNGAVRFPAVPCFRMIARRATVKLAVKKSFVFHDITENYNVLRAGGTRQN